MADPAPAKPAFAGLNLAEDLKDFELPTAARLPRPDRATVAAVSESAGFPHREPRSVKPAAPVRPLNFDARMSLRVAEADKTRFDDLVYRERASVGEVFKRLLDHYEASRK